MIHLKQFSILVIILCLTFVVNAESFGEIQGDVEPIETTDFGGFVYEVPGSDGLMVDYDGSSIDYSGLDGKLTFSEFGKVVEGEVDVSKEGEYVFGNMKLNLAKGAKVVFKDGELSIEDPKDMVTKEDISFVDSDIGFEGDRVKLSGEGVDFHGQSEVYIDETGNFLIDPTDVMFAELTVTGSGKIYFIENSGEVQPSLDGAYVSTGSNDDGGKFSIGSNIPANSVSVLVDSENSYGLRHDASSDHVAFKSISDGNPSFVSVQNRDGANLVPYVDTVGPFAIDNNGHGSYRIDDKIYTTYEASVIPEFGVSEGATVSPVEIHFGNYNSGETASLTNYDGALVIGNDGHIGYGSDPRYTLSGESYARGSRREGSELRHGASNLLAYNYYQGGEQTIENIFNIPISGDRVSVLNAAKGKEFMDILFQTPQVYRRYIKQINLVGTITGRDRLGRIVPEPGTLGLADTTGVVSFAVDRGGFSQRVISHEFAHIFDFSRNGRGFRSVFSGRRNGRNDFPGFTDPSFSKFSMYWERIDGDNLPLLRGSYTGAHEEHIAVFVEQQYRPLGSYWGRYNGDTGVQKRVAALVLGEGITFFNGRRILEAIGAGPIDSIDDVRNVITGGGS